MNKYNCIKMLIDKVIQVPIQFIHLFIMLHTIKIKIKNGRLFLLVRNYIGVQPPQTQTKIFIYPLRANLNLYYTIIPFHPPWLWLQNGGAQMTSSLTHITRNNMHERACTSVGLGPARHPLRGAVGKCATPSPPHLRAPFTNQGTIVRDSYGHVVITCTVPTTGRYRLRILTNIKGKSVPFLKIFLHSFVYKRRDRLLFRISVGF